jgi:FemAB-related protein (PEP-CTERM system-associated)
MGEHWDAFVARVPGSTFCHLAGWREVLSDVLGAHSIYLLCRDREGNWSGVLPLARVKSRLFGHYLISMPFLNYGGPLGPPVTQRWLADIACVEARRAGADLLELRARGPFPSTLDTNHRKITVILSLPDRAEILWQQTFRAKLRSQIRRPMEEGMEARFGPDQVAPFHEVFAHNMRDLGTPVLPRAFFERIATTFAKHVEFGVVYLGERPVAGGCGFVWNGEFELTWASSLREYRPRAPNMLLYWAFMKRLIGLGIPQFNFGRCTPGSGSHRFKQQWGGRDVPLPWLQWSPNGRVAPPSPEKMIYRTASGLWRRLPVAVANRAGPLLARKLP